MIEKIEEYLIEVANFNSSDKEEIEQFRLRFNSKKGILTDLFAQFKDVPNDQKKDFGQKINTLKQAVTAKLDEAKERTESDIVLVKEDLTRPGFPLELGSRHPINLVKNKIIDIFKTSPNCQILYQNENFILL